MDTTTENGVQELASMCKRGGPRIGKSRVALNDVAFFVDRQRNSRGDVLTSTGCKHQECSEVAPAGSFRSRSRIYLRAFETGAGASTHGDPLYPQKKRSFRSQATKQEREWWLYAAYRFAV